jgi:biopolymer transport protein ExbB
MERASALFSPGTEDETNMWEVYEFLARGGPVMIPIALGSITGLAILFERLWSLRRSSVNPSRLLPRVRELQSSGAQDEASRLCAKSGTPMGRILETCFRYHTLPRNEIKGAIEDVGRREVASMNRFVGALGAIAAVSPLLGLLGTVTGMIQAFRQVVSSAGRGAIDPTRLANGIWEALITTAAGLSVAILCYVAFRYLAARAEKLAMEMEAGALELLDDVTGFGTTRGEVPEEPAEAEG